jgi:hypothetical protein
MSQFEKYTAQQLRDELDIELKKCDDISQAYHNAVAKLTKAIEEKEGGHKSKPGKYENVETREFADTKNYSYPLDSHEHVRAAISYFAMPKNHGKYDEADRKTIARKIVSAANKYKINISDEWKEKFGLKEKSDLQKAIFELEESLLKADTKKEKLTITIQNIDSKNKLLELLEYIQQIGNMGHSFEIVIDPDNKQYRKKFFWDGDGSDYIRDVK